MKIIDIIIVLIIALLVIVLVMVIFFPKIKQADVVTEEFGKETLEEYTAVEIEPEVFAGVSTVMAENPVPGPV